MLSQGQSTHYFGPPIFWSLINNIIKNDAAEATLPNIRRPNIYKSLKLFVLYVTDKCFKLRLAHKTNPHLINRCQYNTIDAKPNRSIGR